MEDEVRGVTYLAVGLILLSIVLTFITYGMRVERQMADVRNNQIHSNEAMEQYRKFNAYDNKDIIGDEAIELIRMYYDSGISIFVNTRTNIVSGAVVNNANTTAISGPAGVTGLDDRIFNYDGYVAYKKNNRLDESGYTVKAGALNDAGTSDLRNWFPTDVKYRAFLVYNSASVVDTYFKISDDYAVKGNISDCAPKKPTNADITGIVLVKYGADGTTPLFE